MTPVRQPLMAKLRSDHLRLGFVALAAAGVALTLISFLTLRAYVDQNLSLVARSIAYTAQAAVVFRDTASAGETLTLIGEEEGLAQAELFDAQGQLLARYQRSEQGSLEAALTQMGNLVFPHTARADIVHDGARIGHVSLHGSFAVYLQFLLEVLAAIALCLALVGVIVARMSRRFERDIVAPLDSLASLTRRARVNRAFEMRAPPAALLEINALSEDFNALLAEIHGHELELLKRQKKLLAANEMLSHQAFHDSLTGLPNRAHFLGRLANALDASGPGHAKLAVMYIDCDHFKDINDSLGHAAGDDVLKEFARRLRAQVREGDMVARLGGDEFAIMLTPLRTVDDAIHIAAKAMTALAQPIETQAGPVSTSATLGVAMFPEHGDTLDGLLGCADAVMYRAKRRQRGIYLVADDSDMQTAQSAQSAKATD